MSYRDNRKKFLNHSHSQVCNKDKWTEDRICRLVCLYKKFPCLWKKDNISYMDNSARHSAYGNIHLGMNMCQITFTEIMIKIREVRRMYVIELQKILKAYNSGLKYEPKEKWFYILHKFLYENLDFDESSELQSLEDSASSCYQEDDDEEFYDVDVFHRLVDIDKPQQSANPSSRSSKSEYCTKIPRRIACDSSETSSSTKDCMKFQKSSKCQPQILANNCPMKIGHCLQHDASNEISQVCHKSPKSRISTSITVICDNKSNYQKPRADNASDHDECSTLRSISNEKIIGNFRKESSYTHSCPKSLSIEKYDSDISSNIPLGRSYDEFDVFGKSIACQLRKMDIESAVMVQNQIQNFLTDQRLRKNEPIRPEESEIKDLVGEKLSSPQESITRVTSRMIKPEEGSTSKRRLTPKLVNQIFRKNEIRNVEKPDQGIVAKRLPIADQKSQRKTKKGLFK